MSKNIYNTPSPEPTGEWYTPTRSSVIFFCKQLRKLKSRYPKNTISKNDIFKLAEVPKTTGNRWVRQNTSRRIGKRRPGRTSKLSDELLDVAEDYILDNGYPGRTSHWQEIIEDLQLPVTGFTLRRRLNQRGFKKFKAAQTKYLNDDDIKNRLEFCIEHADPAWRFEIWKDVKFSDEVHVSLDARNADWVIRKRGERFLPEAMQFKKKRQSSYFHCWAAIGYNYKSPLVIYGEGKGMGNLTMSRYLYDILQPFILPAVHEATANGQRFILEEDNDGAHGTRSKNNPVRRFKEENGIEWYANPPNSPDFSPIENVWRILKQRVKKHRCINLQSLKDALLYEWERIGQTQINNLVTTMPDRMAECIKHRGLHTRY